MFSNLLAVFDIGSLFLYYFIYCIIKSILTLEAKKMFYAAVWLPPQSSLAHFPLVNSGYAVPLSSSRTVHAGRAARLVLNCQTKYKLQMTLHMIYPRLLLVCRGRFWKMNYLSQSHVT